MKGLRLGDPRTQGSNNIGASNVLRTGSKTAALLTLLFDFSKSLLPIFLYIKATHVSFEYPLGAWFPVCADPWALFVACGAILGHIFPVWLKFKGGKGVATIAGAYILLNPLCFLLGMLVWLAVFLKTKIASLASLSSLCVFLPLFSGYWSLSASGVSSSFYFSLAVAGIVFWAHRANVKRLLTGTEVAFKKN
ncbi:glycerol-3-phosphate acyltransferase [Alphaproteobacteria bacterium]|nr:glycerol-3-phosphate acyltransferase [Alphaproteobacteria bacterium]